jgi:hypothetical protein
LFQVFLDGEKVAEHLLDWKSDPVSLDIDTSKREEIELVVDFGDPEKRFYEDPVNDIANWGNALLIQ